MEHLRSFYKWMKAVHDATEWPQLKKIEDEAAEDANLDELGWEMLSTAIGDKIRKWNKKAE